MPVPLSFTLFFTLFLTRARFYFAGFYLTDTFKIPFQDSEKHFFRKHSHLARRLLFSLPIPTYTTYMTSIPAKHTITSTIIIAAVIAAGANVLPSLRAQSRLPAQGGFGSSDFSSPSPLAPSPSPFSQDGSPDDATQDNTVPLPSALAANDMPMMDDGAPPLVGSVDNNNNYIHPTGAFRIRVPVYPELGGEINDTENVVTFQDAFGEHYSIGVFPMTPQFLVEEVTRGHKDFLDWFFQTFIEADFRRTIPSTTHEPSARYNAGTQGGALFTILNIPDGSVYMERVFVFPPRTPVIAKRGNLVFVRDRMVYVLSTELSERIFEYSTWKKTPAEEEEILRQRLYDLLSRMIFTKAAASATPPAIAPTPAPTLAPAPTSPTGTTTAIPAVTYPAPAPATTGAAGSAPAK